MKLPDRIRYQAYFCEENVWWLCRDPDLATLDRRAVFISNDDRCCLLEHQRAGGAAGEVVWDYHVILLVADARRWWVVDPDTLLGMPVPAGEYLAATFAGAALAPEVAPRFRVVAGDRLVEVLSSDRRHMRAPDGSWLHPPPDWDPPAGTAGVGSNLMAFVDVAEEFEGELLDLDAMVARFDGDPAAQRV